MGEVFEKFQIIGKNRGDWRSHGLIAIPFHHAGLRRSLAAVLYEYALLAEVGPNWPNRMRPGAFVADWFCPATLSGSAPDEIGRP